VRFYDIQVTSPEGLQTARWTSFVDGKTIPGALNVEFDIPIFTQDAPMGGGYIKIWGVGLKTVGQASDFNGSSIKIYGGMQKGLPLANPTQAGLLVSGIIQQAFGNWQGVEQSIDFQVLPGLGSEQTPANIVLDWKAGQPMGDALNNALGIAYPNHTIDVQISDALKLAADEKGFHASLSNLSQYAKATSQNILGGDYPGVSIAVQDTTIKVYDNTSPPGPVAIAFNDLIGQPTWINFAAISVRCVLRSDLHVGSIITMPQTSVITGANSYSQYRDKSAFQGNFQITQARHLGHFRQADASSWVTAFQAVEAGT
jgi:hypothetical protein